MMQDVVGWMFVLVSAVVFAGFLFGISSALTLMSRMLRAPRPALRFSPVRAPARVRAEPRLWA